MAEQRVDAHLTLAVSPSIVYITMTAWTVSFIVVILVLAEQAQLAKPHSGHEN